MNKTQFDNEVNSILASSDFRHGRTMRDYLLGFYTATTRYRPSCKSTAHDRDVSPSMFLEFVRAGLCAPVKNELPQLKPKTSNGKQMGGYEYFEEIITYQIHQVDRDLNLYYDLIEDGVIKYYDGKGWEIVDPIKYLAQMEFSGDPLYSWKFLGNNFRVWDYNRFTDSAIRDYPTTFQHDSFGMFDREYGGLQGTCWFLKDSLLLPSLDSKYKIQLLTLFAPPRPYQISTITDLFSSDVQRIEEIRESIYSSFNEIVNPDGSYGFECAEELIIAADTETGRHVVSVDMDNECLISFPLWGDGGYLTCVMRDGEVKGWCFDIQWRRGYHFYKGRPKYKWNAKAYLTHQRTIMDIASKDEEQPSSAKNDLLSEEFLRSIGL